VGLLGEVRGAAVARLIAHRLARRQRSCSAQIGVYGQARLRLPDSFFAEVACSVGRRLIGLAHAPAFCEQ